MYGATGKQQESAQVKEESSDADDEHVVQDETFDPSEQDSSHLDAVPIQLKRFRQGSLPQIRDELVSFSNVPRTRGVTQCG